MKTEEIPSLPTREQELNYLNFLEASFNSDPWLTIHPRKYMANPHRLAYKNRMSYRKEYYKTFLKNFLATVIITTPLTF